MGETRAERPAAVFFDLDDTLLACAASPEACWRQLCHRFAPQVPRVRAEDLSAAVERHRSWFWSDRARHRTGRLDLTQARRAIVAGAFRELGLDAADVGNALADAFTSEREDTLDLLPNALDTLQRLRGDGVRLALLTNGSREFQRRKIERFGLADLFDCIVIEGEFGAGKPDTRVYQHALERIGVHPAETWMVGDNLEWDVAAPQRVGISGIWFDRARQGLPADCSVTPDRIISTLSELASDSR